MKIKAMNDLSDNKDVPIRRWAVVGLLTLLLSPALASTLLIQISFGAGWDAFIPVWNDEILYWHEVLTFAVHGFGGGHYSIEELIPKATFTTFGTHGPFFPMLYGTIAKVVGWTKSSGPLFNICALTLALTAFVYVARPQLRQLAAATAIVAFFWPILLYIPTNMQESLHQAIAIVLAALCCRLLSTERSSPLLIYLILVGTAIAALIRPTWSFLFLALALAQSPRRLSYGSVRQVFLAISSMAAFFVLLRFITAPYPDNFVYLLCSQLGTDPLAALIFFAKHLAVNISAFLRFDLGSPLEILLRYIVLALLIYLFFYIKRGHNFEAEENQSERVLFRFSFYNLLFILMFILLFYDVGDWRDFRLLAPHLLLSLLILAIIPKKWIVLSAVFAFLMLSLVFYKTFLTFHQPHFNREVDLTTHFSPITPYILYDKEKGPWANSLLFDIRSVQYFLTDVPSGIGIGAVLNWNRVAFPPKSRYLFIPTSVYLQIRNRARLKLLSSSPLGNLFLNLDSQDD